MVPHATAPETQVFWPCLEVSLPISWHRHHPDWLHTHVDASVLVLLTTPPPLPAGLGAAWQLQLPL